MELLKKYLTKYPKHTWYSTTVAFEGFLSIDPGFGDNVALYWDACICAIKRMVTEGYFNGAVWSEELHVQSFLTYEVQPHVHVVFVADQVTMEHIELLKSYVREYRGYSYDPQQGCLVPDDDIRVEYPISTRTRRIETKYHFANALSYLAKPNDLHEAYKRDFEQVSQNGRGGVAALNQDVSEVLAGIGNAAYKRRQIDYKGNLDARSRTRFVGVKKADRARKSHYTNVQTVLAVENLEHGVLDNPDTPEHYGLSIEEVHEEQNRDVTD